MLDHLVLPEYGELVLNSIEDLLEEGHIRTPDLGGRSSTIEVGDAIVEKLLDYVGKK